MRPSLAPPMSADHLPAPGHGQGQRVACRVARFPRVGGRVHHVRGTTPSHPRKAWANPGPRAQTLPSKAGQEGRGSPWAGLPHRQVADPGFPACHGRIRP